MSGENQLLKEIIYIYHRVICYCCLFGFGTDFSSFEGKLGTGAASVRWHCGGVLSLASVCGISAFPPPLQGMKDRKSTEVPLWGRCVLALNKGNSGLGKEDTFPGMSHVLL